MIYFILSVVLSEITSNADSPLNPDICVMVRWIAKMGDELTIVQGASIHKCFHRDIRVPNCLYFSTCPWISDEAVDLWSDITARVQPFLHICYKLITSDDCVEMTIMLDHRSTVISQSGDWMN